MADMRELLRKLQAEQAQYTPEKVAQLRAYYIALGGAALEGAEDFRRRSDAPVIGEQQEPSWQDLGRGPYPL